MAYSLLEAKFRVKMTPTLGGYVKALFFASMFLVFSSYASAQTASECRRSCSRLCLELADTLMQDAREIQANCGSNGPAEGDIVDVCHQSFYSNADRLECSSTAHTAGAVKECVSSYYSNSDRLTCIAGARNEGVVKACVQGFYSGKDRLECTRRARSESVVKSCIANYYSITDRLNCMGN